MEFIQISKLFGSKDIFVIPTFQRPYAWELPQWEDVLRDIETAVGKKPPSHYFGAIHTIRVDVKSALWRDYTDQINPDIQSLTACDFQTNGGAVDVHFVVDGQQRLITLFSLLECSRKDPITRFVTLDQGNVIPTLILNPANDHAHWRASLFGTQSPPIQTRSQERLRDMFETFNHKAPKPGSDGFKFLMGHDCNLMQIKLDPKSSLSPFLTLNDRGKALTRLEILKGMAMAADENGSCGYATALNTGFGAVYRSIDQIGSKLDEDGFLRQLSIGLWEGATPALQAHRESFEELQKKYRSELSAPSTGSKALVNSIVTQSGKLAKEHTELVSRITDSVAGKAMGQPGFVNALFPCAPPRDASDDYLMVLESFGLQPKQIAMLLAVRDHCQVDWHESLGHMRVSNVAVKRELAAEFAKHMTPDLADQDWSQAIKNEIDSIPDESVRQVTPLYLAELLRVIVGDSKPGYFNAAWQGTFGVAGISSQSFLDVWVGYLTSHGSRDNFIHWAIGQNLNNQSFELRHVLREYESCLPNGLNAHRQAKTLEVEHYFSRDYSSIAAASGHVFASEADYGQNFVDRPGNKLMLDSSLNRAIKSLPPLTKTIPYGSGSYGSVSIPAVSHVQSAIQIANDLRGCTNLGAAVSYVVMRQLRLAVFAANRF